MLMVEVQIITGNSLLIKCIVRISFVEGKKIEMFLHKVVSILTLILDVSVQGWVSVYQKLCTTAHVAYTASRLVEVRSNHPQRTNRVYTLILRRSVKKFNEIQMIFKCYFRKFWSRSCHTYWWA